MVPSQAVHYICLYPGHPMLNFHCIIDFSVNGVLWWAAWTLIIGPVHDNYIYISVII